MRTIKQQTTGWPDLRRVEIHGTYALRTQLWATWINGNCHRTLAWDPERESYVNSIKSLTQGKTIKRQTVLEHETDWIRKTIHIQYRSKSLKKDIPAGKDQGTFLGHTWQGIVPIPQWERITVSTVCVCACTRRRVHRSGYVFLNEPSCHPVARTLILLKNLKMLYNLWLGNILYRGPSLGKSL